MRACFVFGLNCLLRRERALVPAKAANMPTYRGPAVTRQVRMVWFICVMRTLPTELCARRAARAGAAGRATHFCAAAHDHRDERKWAAVPWVPRCVSNASADVHRRTDLGLPWKLSACLHECTFLSREATAMCCVHVFAPIDPRVSTLASHALSPRVSSACSR